MGHQLQSSAQGDNDTADGTSHPPPSKTLLHNSQKLTSGVSHSPSSIDPVTPNRGDESNAAVIAERNLSLVGSASLVFVMCLFLGESLPKPLSWKFSRIFIQDTNLGPAFAPLYEP